MHKSMSNKINKDDRVLTENQQKSLQSLREQINNIVTIKNINADDEYLLRFLYCTDFYVPQALSRIKEYYQNMLDYPDWYTKDSPIDKKSFIERDISVIVPSVFDKNGRPIYLLKLGNIDTHTTKITDTAALEDIWFEYLLDKHPEICGKGLCMILDFEGITWKFFTRFNYRKLKLYFSRMKSLPFKEFEVHLVNNSRVIKLFINVISSFIPGESRKEIRWNFTNWEGLYEHIEKDSVPPEYGGYNKLNYKKIYEKLYEKSDIIFNNFKSYRSVIGN